MERLDQAFMTSRWLGSTSKVFFNLKILGWLKVIFMMLWLRVIICASHRMFSPSFRFWVQIC
ncbi:hypothetical protein V6Z11_A10G126100 [Gossypium hirsutum]